MRKECCLASKGILFAAFVLFLFQAGLLTADVEKKTVEIEGSKVRKIEEAKEVVPVKKIEEEHKLLIPEIPQPQKEGLSPAAKVRLQLLEQEVAQGKITETEYEIEKDKLTRESNMKF